MSIFTGILFIVFVLSLIRFQVLTKSEDVNVDGFIFGITLLTSVTTGILFLLCIGHYIAVLLA